MAKKILSRQIRHDVERRLWALAAGRCEFHGCNRPVFKSPVTQEHVNILEKAHIYSFAEKGPRGHGPLKKNQINDISNLMLVCHDCHKKIDQDKKGIRYSAKLLQTWKQEHEKRIAIVTGVRLVEPRFQSRKGFWQEHWGCRLPLGMPAQLTW